MGTRGLFGLYKDGMTKSTYNHYDSYPSGLGQDIVNFIKGTSDGDIKPTSIEEMNKMFDDIVFINEDIAPTKEQIEECKPWTNLTVSSRSVTDWYCLIREAQGDLNAYKNGLKYMFDSRSFITDSLFCEYAYIINLEDNVFECYVGFQREFQDNRYAIKKPLDSGYYSCALKAMYPLDNIPDNWADYDNETEE